MLVRVEIRRWVRRALHFLGAADRWLRRRQCLADALPERQLGRARTAWRSFQNVLHGRPTGHIHLVYGRVVEGEHVRRVFGGLLSRPLTLLTITILLVEKRKVVRILAFLALAGLYGWVLTGLSFCGGLAVRVV